MIKRILSALCVLLILLSAFPSFVFAEGESSSVDISDGGTITAGGSFSVNVTITVNGFNATAGEMSIHVDSGLEITGVSGGEYNSGQIIWFNSSGASSFSATVNIKATTDFIGSHKTISISGHASGSDGITTPTTNGSTTVYMASSNNDLSSLKVNGTTLTGFSAETTSYTISNTDAASITIAATASDAKAKLSGTGSVNLVYGANTINVVVTAESGAQKTYSISVSRNDNRSADNSLATLSVDAGDIHFTKNNTSFNLQVDYNITEVELKATATDPKATVVSGPGKYPINVGINTINVVVKAENDKEKTYSVYIVRKDIDGKTAALSKNNYLSALTISKNVDVGGVMSPVNIDFGFDPETLEYSFFVENSVSAVSVSAVAADLTAAVTVDAPSSLIVGTNIIKVTTTSQSAEGREYIIRIVRYDDSIHATIDTLAQVLATPNPTGVITLDFTSEDESEEVTSEILDLLKTSGNQLKIDKYADGILRYEWLLDTKNINFSNGFDSKVEFIELDSEKYVKAKKENDGIDLAFAYSGELPQGTRIRIYVADKFDDGTLLNLYSYNTEKKRMEIVSEEPLNVQNGYVEYSLEHCSEYYFLTDATIKPVNWLIIGAIAGVVLLGGGAALFFILRNKKKKSSYYEDDEFDETNEYDEQNDELFEDTQMKNNTARTKQNGSRAAMEEDSEQGRTQSARKDTQPSHVKRSEPMQAEMHKEIEEPEVESDDLFFDDLDKLFSDDK